MLLAYSIFYRYEAPTVSGIPSLYSSNIWFAPSLITLNNYKRAITITGIVPYSFGDLKHVSLDFSYRIKNNLFLFSGLKTRKLLNIYGENTAVFGTAFKLEQFGISANVRGIYQYTNEKERLFSATIDLSGTYRINPFIITYTVLNVLKPTLSFSSNKSSKISQRFTVVLNSPSSVYFTFGYEKTESYDTPFMSTEIRFTRGFGIVFGVEDNTVEGGFDLKSKNVGIGIRIKSHTLMGPTYITYISLFRE